jgi:Domain of unknown function (DUF4956)/VTC domain
MSTAMSLLAGLASDLAAIVLLAYAVYFRRYHRRDLLLAYVALNVGVLAVTVLLAGARAGIGLGLGLFGILSIIRLRSDQITRRRSPTTSSPSRSGSSTVSGRPLAGSPPPVCRAGGDHVRRRPSTARWSHPPSAGDPRRGLPRPCRAASSVAAAARRRGAPRGCPRDRHGARCHRRRRPLPNSSPSPRAACGFGPPARAGDTVTAGSRVSAVVAGSVAGLPPASLAEVIERSALQARIEHKYLVPLERLAELAARLPDTYAVLEIDQLRGFAYESVHFDTPDLLTYRQHLQGRRRRYKVRTRAYLDSGDCMFEVKLKGRRAQTIKARLSYPGRRPDTHQPAGARVPRRAAPGGVRPARTPAGRDGDHRLSADHPGRPPARHATHL